MSRQLPIPPDPVTLREALRGLRHMLRRGGETLAETMSVDTLPEPAAQIATRVMHEVRDIARNLDGIASGLAKTALGGTASGVARLSDLARADDADGRFALAVYVALRSVLDRLGAPGVFVSEHAARKVYMAALARGDGSPAALAARLTLDLLGAGVIRGATAQEAARVPGAALEPVAIFAVLLWLQSARSEDENEAALDAATDLAVAVSADLARVAQAGDGPALQGLYDRYAPHV